MPWDEQVPCVSSAQNCYDPELHSQVTSEVKCGCWGLTRRKSSCLSYFLEAVLGIMNVTALFKTAKR